MQLNQAFLSVVLNLFVKKYNENKKAGKRKNEKKYQFYRDKHYEY